MMLDEVKKILGKKLSSIKDTWEQNDYMELISAIESSTLDVCDDCTLVMYERDSMHISIDWDKLPKAYDNNGQRKKGVERHIVCKNCNNKREEL